MDDFRTNLILAYFKEKGNNYSYLELANLLGVGTNRLEGILDILIEQKMLLFNELRMLQLTEKGRLSLLNNQVDYYKFDNVTEELVFKDPWPIDRPYFPKKFLSKI